MAMSRAALVTEVAGELSQALAELGIAATDTAGALREPINRTFRALGAAEEALLTSPIADGDEDKAIAFATYFVLNRLVNAAHGMIDLSAAGGAGLKQQQTMQSLKQQRDGALTVAVAHGLAGYTAKTSASVTPIPLAGGIARAAYFTNEPSGAGQW